MLRSTISPVFLFMSSLHVSYSLGNKYAKKKHTSPNPYGAAFCSADSFLTFPTSFSKSPKNSLPCTYTNSSVVIGAFPNQ